MALQEVIEARGSTADSVVAAHAKIDRKTISRWRENPAFEEWVNAHLELAVEQHWPKVLTRATQLAVKGSIDHMNFLAKIGGRFKQLEPGAGGHTTKIEVLIPRP